MYVVVLIGPQVSKEQKLNVILFEDEARIGLLCSSNLNPEGFCKEISISPFSFKLCHVERRPSDTTRNHKFASIYLTVYVRKISQFLRACVICEEEL
jgi:hypothetical protein